MRFAQQFSWELVCDRLVVHVPLRGQDNEWFQHRTMYSKHPECEQEFVLILIHQRYLLTNRWLLYNLRHLDWQYLAEILIDESHY
jgi:hypothetical protein